VKAMQLSQPAKGDAAFSAGEGDSDGDPAGAGD